MKKNILKLWVPILVVAGLFLFFAYLAQHYGEVIKGFIQQDNFLGVFSYIVINIGATVVAPVSALPLLPIAASIWGAFWAGVFSIIGWTIGAIIAFFLARKFGQPLVKKIISIEKIEKIEKIIPSNHIFWSIVFLRIAVPVDILSYALGLFSNINYIKYSIATLIGIIPFAFIFAYVGTFSAIYQIVALILSGAVFLLGLRFISVKNKKTIL